MACVVFKCIFNRIGTEEQYYLFTKTLLLMSYSISYHHALGDASIRCYAWEVAGILRNMVHMALQGHEFSNVTITKI
jgi:hypothetical protein